MEQKNIFIKTHTVLCTVFIAPYRATIYVKLSGYAKRYVHKKMK